MVVPPEVLYWLPLLRERAKAYSLEVAQVVALVWKESAPPGNPRSYRYEPGFWTRYLASKPEWTRGLTGTDLSMWARRCSASYGLMQIMYPVACERGLPAASPPECLFDPHECVTWGCLEWKRCLGKAPDLRGAAVLWNGPEGSPAYEDQFLSMLGVVRATLPPGGQNNGQPAGGTAVASAEGSVPGGPEHPSPVEPDRGSGQGV